MQTPISVTVLSYNSASTLRETLESLKSFPEVIVVDTGSTDGTVEIGKSYPNVKMYETHFTGFGELHNFATSLASNDWVLSVDSDEVLSGPLIQEIDRLILNRSSVYSIQRDNFFNQKRIRCCSWYPDRVVRLYNRQATRFSDDSVHEKVVTDGVRLVELEQPLLHTPYRTTNDFLAKMQKYSTLFAEQHRGKKRASFTKAVFHGVAAFCKDYILKRGVFGGKEGFIISLYNAHTTYYKYLKLAELNKKL